jgi:glycosyltransferase involved in cell wall biosynthesis
MKNLAILDISYATKIQNREKTIAHIEYWLKNSNFPILIISGPDGIVFYESIFGGQLSYLILPCSKKVLNPNIFVICFEYIARIFCILLLKVNYDLTHIYTVTSQFHDICCLCLLKIKFKSVKTFATFDNFVPKPYSRPGNYLRNILAYSSHLITRRLLHFVDCIFAYLNDPNFTLLKSYFSSNKRIIQLENGLDLNLITTTYISPDTTFDIVYLGRIHEAKGIFDFLTISKNLTKSFPNLKIAIAGSGDTSSTAKFKLFLKENRLLDNITFFGFVSTSEKYKILKSSKIFIAPSYDESFPISTIEAYACSCQIIVYALPVYKNPPYINFSLKLVKVGSIEGLLRETAFLLAQNYPISKPDFSLITGYTSNAKTELDNFLNL